MLQPTETSIMLHSGRIFDYVNLEDNDIIIEDIAHGLSMTCRYGGHCNRFLSVAEHSICVSMVCTNPLDGLLHDASEFVMNDLPSPLKAMLPDYKALEHMVQSSIMRKLGLPEEMSADTKHWDNAVASAEVRQVMPYRWQAWWPKGIITVPPANVYFSKGLSQAEAKEMFIQRYKVLVQGDTT